MPWVPKQTCENCPLSGIQDKNLRKAEVTDEKALYKSQEKSSSLRGSAGYDRGQNRKIKNQGYQILEASEV
ncbi:Tigger Transposable Element-Derived Protein 1 [Manis pentadactyla]|nr:Tigger Transposable Element-Derived Protein 1 [Manis pentadactyla]